jgi:hypothetical protein
MLPEFILSFECRAAPTAFVMAFLIFLLIHWVPFQEVITRRGSVISVPLSISIRM